LPVRAEEFDASNAGRLSRMGVGRILEPVARKLPFETAMRVVNLLLRSQGIGSGDAVSTSGEERVFDLISSKAPVLFDVGGHAGEYSKMFLKRFPLGTSMLFEPSAVHMEIAEQALPDRVRFFRVALNSAAGTASLYKDKSVSGMASLTKRDLDYRNIKMDVVETVACRTLDSVVDETGIERIDLLKIDVEGHELDVLKGAEKAFAENRIGLVQFEFGGCNLDTRTTMADFFRFFQARGYVLHIVRPAGDVVALPKYHEAYEQYQTSNYLAKKP
jgi:FkbM family methyltransferase